MRRSNSTLLTFIYKAVLSVISLVNSILTARYFSQHPVDRLEFQFTQSITTTGTSWLGGYNGYFSYALSRRHKDANQIIQMGNLFIFGASFVIWMVALCIRLIVGPTFDLWLWAGLCMPFSFMVNYSTQLLQGTNEISWLNRLNMAQPVLFLLLYLPIFLDKSVPIGQRLTLTYLVWGITFVLAAGAGLLLGYRLLRHQDVFHWRFWRQEWRGIFNYGQWLSISNLVNWANYRMDFWLVAAYIPGKIAAGYTVAVAASEVLLNISQSVTSVVYTRMSAATRKEAIEITEVSTRQTFISSAIVAIAMYILFPWLIVHAFGREWSGALDPFYILLPGLVFKATSNVILQFFTNQMGRPQTAIVMNGSSAIINATLCVIFLPTVGMVGGAIASTGSYVLSFVGYVWWFAHVNKVGPGGLLRLRRTDLQPYLALVKRAIPGRR